MARYIDSYKEYEVPFGAHITQILIQSEENIIYCSIKLDVILRSMDISHPISEFYSKLLGINGYKIPNEKMRSFLMNLRHTLR